jgi:two-component sensor histidine kinase
VGHGKIDRRVPAGLAGNIPTVAAFQHWICSILRRFVDRGAVVPCADPAGRILYPVFSGGILCHRVRRFPGRDRDRDRRGTLGLTLNFSDAPVDFARLALLVIYLIVCGLTIWGVEHYRSIASRQRQISKRLIQEEGYRKLVVDELQHRLKNKLSTIHAVLHQILEGHPQIWARIDQRMRALSATDDLIARVDGNGCDLKDLLLSELGPYGHVRFTLNGNPLFLPAKLAVSLALMFHELATNAGKYGAFSSARGLLQVSWSVSDDRLNITWDETEGPPVGAIGEAGFGTKLLKSALGPFDGKTEIAFLKTGVHCTMQCRIPAS